jgi:hypothetical protein
VGSVTITRGNDDVDDGRGAVTVVVVAVPVVVVAEPVVVVVSAEIEAVDDGAAGVRTAVDGVRAVHPTQPMIAAAAITAAAMRVERTFNRLCGFGVATCRTMSRPSNGGGSGVDSTSS